MQKLLKPLKNLKDRRYRANPIEKKRRTSDGENLVPNTIRLWREFRGYTFQSQLATEAGLSSNTVHRLESFALAYTPYTLQALARVLRCEPGDLISIDPNKPEAEIMRIYRGVSSKRQSEIVKAVRKLAHD